MPCLCVPRYSNMRSDVTASPTYMQYMFLYFVFSSSSFSFFFFSFSFSLTNLLRTHAHTHTTVWDEQALGPQYSPRTYVSADTDRFSCGKIEVVEGVGAKGEECCTDWSMLTIPRSREVRQGMV